MSHTPADESTNSRGRSGSAFIRASFFRRSEDAGIRRDVWITARTLGAARESNIGGDEGRRLTVKRPVEMQGARHPHPSLTGVARVDAGRAGTLQHLGVDYIVFSVVWYYDIVIVIAITVTVSLVKDVVKLFYFIVFLFFFVSIDTILR